MKKIDQRELITKLFENEPRNVEKLGKLRSHLENRFNIKEIPIDELIYCFSEDKVSETCGFVNSDTYALMGDKLLDHYLYELLFYEFEVTEKDHLDEVRKYTTKEKNMNKLIELGLNKYFLLRTDERRGDYRVKKDQHDSTHEALIYLIYKNCGIDFLKDFLLLNYASELREIAR